MSVILIDNIRFFQKLNIKGKLAKFHSDIFKLNQNEKQKNQNS